MHIGTTITAEAVRHKPDEKLEINAIVGSPKALHEHFELASVTKSLTVDMLTSLIPPVKWSSSEVVDILPEYAWLNGITIDDMVKHQTPLNCYTQLEALLNYDATNWSNSDVIHEFDGLIISAPQARVRYSNTNYILLAQVLERLATTTYGALLENYCQRNGLTGITLTHSLKEPSLSYSGKIDAPGRRVLRLEDRTYGPHGVSATPTSLLTWAVTVTAKRHKDKRIPGFSADGLSLSGTRAGFQTWVRSVGDIFQCGLSNESVICAGGPSEPVPDGLRRATHADPVAMPQEGVYWSEFDGSTWIIRKTTTGFVLRNFDAEIVFCWQTSGRCESADGLFIVTERDSWILLIVGPGDATLLQLSYCGEYSNPNASDCLTYARGKHLVNLCREPGRAFMQSRGKQRALVAASHHVYVRPGLRLHIENEALVMEMPRVSALRFRRVG
jgi:hypothetical protein